MAATTTSYSTLPVHEQEQEIRRILNITEEQYAQQKYDLGLRFLHTVTGGDEGIIHHLERSKLFWGWWRSQWTHREEDYLLTITSRNITIPHSRAVLWSTTHNLTDLMAEVDERGRRFCASYAKVIGLINREIRAQESKQIPQKTTQKRKKELVKA